MTCEQIDKKDKTLMELKSRCVDEQKNLSKRRQPAVEKKSNVSFVVQKLNNKIAEANAWQIGCTSFTRDHLKRGINFCNQYLALAKKNGDLTGEAAAYYSLGTAYHFLGDYGRALEYKRLLHAICRNLEDRVVENWACHILAIAYENTGDLTTAIKYYKDWMNYCKVQGDKIGEQAACDSLGNTYYKHCDYKLALECFQRSLVICKELGNRPGEGKANGCLGLMYADLKDFRNAVEHYQIAMHIFQELGDQSGEASIREFLCGLCLKTGDFIQAEEYLKKQIQATKKLKNRVSEELARSRLGMVYSKRGNYKQAIECFKRCLAFVQNTGDRVLESIAYCHLGSSYLDSGDFKLAIEYFKTGLTVSKEVEDRDTEGFAYGNLAQAYCSLGNYKLAIHYYNQCLSICKELKDREGEVAVRTNLGITYGKVGNFKRAMELYQESIKISRELGDKAGEGDAIGNLGNAFLGLGDLKQAVECFSRSLKICQETGLRDHEGTMYGNLGCAHLTLGHVNEAKEFFTKHLAICKELGSKRGEGLVYGNLSNVYRHLKKYAKAMNCHKKHLSIFQELGDKDEEGKAYHDLGQIQECLGQFEEAKESYNKRLLIAKEIGNRDGEGGACLSLCKLFLYLGNMQQAMEFSKQHLIICKETGDIRGEASAYLYQGHCLKKLGFLSDALVLYQSSVQQYNHVRSMLHSKDGWKIDLRNDCRAAYRELWNVLLKLDRAEEVLVAAEQGRAQALVDLLVSQYGFDLRQCAHVSQEELASELLSITNSNTLFLAVYEIRNRINVWLLQYGENVQFSKQKSNADGLTNADEDLDFFIKKTYREIDVSSDVSCEDRSLDALHSNDDLTVQESDLSLLSIGKNLRNLRIDCKTESAKPAQKNGLSTLYYVIVAPVFHKLRGNELVIVADGPLFLVPFAALQDAESRYLCESFRIRVIPSLTCLKMIMDAPPDHHCKSGALIVGDPWVQEVVDILGVPKLTQLPFARKEAEMIGAIVKNSPLIGSDATKEEVLKRLNSVALIHLAAHGRIETGEIALAPNTSRKSRIPKEEDFVLTMSDVLSVGLRARLVVLSCCHSGRGEIKDEGVVGIARAFLGAGARSVLVSLWAIEDKATLEFMRVFYQHLVEGKKASEALNCATNYMRESKDFGKICQWAPFLLIGDDVTLDFLQGK